MFSSESGLSAQCSENAATAPEPALHVAPLDDATLDDRVLQQMAAANFGDRPIALVPTCSAWRRVELVKAWASVEPLLTTDELAEHVRAAALVTRGRL